jgi:hypothetical protein
MRRSRRAGSSTQAPADCGGRGTALGQTGDLPAAAATPAPPRGLRAGHLTRARLCPFLCGAFVRRIGGNLTLTIWNPGRDDQLVLFDQVDSRAGRLARSARRTSTSIRSSPRVRATRTIPRTRRWPAAGAWLLHQHGGAEPVNESLSRSRCTARTYPGPSGRRQEYLAARRRAPGFRPLRRSPARPGGNGSAARPIPSTHPRSRGGQLVARSGTSAFSRVCPD